MLMTRPTTISRQDEAGTGPRARWSLYRHSYKQNGSGYEGKHYITLIVFVKTWGIPSHQHTRNSHRHEYITAVGYPFAWKKKTTGYNILFRKRKKEPRLTFITIITESGPPRWPVLLFYTRFGDPTMGRKLYSRNHLSHFLPDACRESGQRFR